MPADGPGSVSFKFSKILRIAKFTRVKESLNLRALQYYFNS